MGNKFEYSYSAPTEEERKEIESIKNGYMPQIPVPDGIEKLRRLDRKVKLLPHVLAWILGVTGLLVFGVGLTCSLEWALYVAGVAVSVVGVAIMIANPFIYRALLASRKAKYSAEIISLSQELLNGENK